MLRDLTGIEAYRRPGRRDRSSGAVNRISNFVKEDSTEFGDVGMVVIKLSSVIGHFASWFGLRCWLIAYGVVSIIHGQW